MTTYDFRKVGCKLRGDKGLIIKQFATLGTAQQYAFDNNLTIVRFY